MYIRDATGDEPSNDQELGTPRPGHGTVFVVTMRDGSWWGSWQDDFPATEHGPRAGVEEFYGDRDAVVQWAKSRPAAHHLIFSTEANDYVPLT